MGWLDHIETLADAGMIAGTYFRLKYVGGIGNETLVHTWPQRRVL
jgi:hypothetical protein